MATTPTTRAAADDGGGEEPAEDIDYEALGLWDDGPCDEAAEPLRIGLMTTFESPVISLGDQAVALEASAEAFNARGGANGSCIEVTTCDDGANLDQALACVPTLEDAGVVATVNDQGTAGQAEVSTAMQEAGIPRVASNVTNFDWGDPNAYPLDASGTGVTFLLAAGADRRRTSPRSASSGSTAPAPAPWSTSSSQIYEGDATFPYDAPVPGGTTDFTQFILGAEDAGAGGVTLALGEQEAVQVVRAGQQLGTDLVIGSSLGTFPHASIAELGDFADQMAFMWSYPPATADLPVYEALRADLAASGEEALQLENLKASPMRSWIGLYALLYMMREADMTEFTGRGHHRDAAGGRRTSRCSTSSAARTGRPNLDHPGMFKRAGIEPLGHLRVGPRGRGPRRARGQLGRGLHAQLRRGPLRLAVRRAAGGLLTGELRAGGRPSRAARPRAS